MGKKATGNPVSEKKPFAVVVGDINIDIITPPFDPAVLVHGETSCVLDEFTMSLGGNAINMAASLAAMGDPHLFIGGMSDCAISEWIQKRCKQLGVNTAFGFLPGKSAGITFALTYTGGKRQFVATLGTNKLITANKLDLASLQKAGPGFHLHRAGFWYTPRLKGAPTIQMFKDVISRGGETSLDVGWDPENFSESNRKLLYETLNYTKYFFGNEKEFKAITKKDDIQGAYRELLGISIVIDNPVLVVHRGEKGCAIITRKEQIFVDPVPIQKVINPTGSGDVFNGGFVHGLLQGWEFRKAAEFAGKVAAVHLQDISKIYPTLADINQILPAY